MTLPGSPKFSVHSTRDDYASYLPRDIPYSSSFEDSITSLLLEPVPIKQSTADTQDVAKAELPRIDIGDLPLTLSDPRRKFPSPVPGLLLTHPGGYLEGGPGLSPAADEFAAHFIADHAIRDESDLRRILDQEIEKQIIIARDRASARRRAMDKNGSIRKEIEEMEEQLKLEMRVLGKARERAQERRERRERRR